MSSQIENAKKVFLNNFAIQSNETILIICDDKMKKIASYFYQAAQEMNHEVCYLQFPAHYHSGEEPPKAVAAAMLQVDIVLCVTSASLTHTIARKKLLN
ncbi:hypothetical protein LZ578_10400 [Jeotgalibaca sp. MA1X17-3]|uniref:hypothetical protein n=1 Tax=Jeotgalibaca sp. MA1X17-3 TaxID=2908211 RepID=UPI001F1706B0|nr:hypothetical protein [Jeotgalibaca sp. MA1X17-3]UJF15369.1 hypothetical protein LZ578_10400 [Jeotgalibaca sp. MA1X17-3]